MDVNEQQSNISEHSFNYIECQKYILSNLQGNNILLYMHDCSCYD